jgi:hypothetical protein
MPLEPVRKPFAEWPETAFIGGDKPPVAQDAQLSRRHAAAFASFLFWIMGLG